MKMQVEIDVDKTAQQNAADYYEKSKKIKAKLQGLNKAIQDTQLAIKHRQITTVSNVVEKKIDRDKKWFEKFHWFNISDKIIIAGRDAKSNQELFKKHMEPNDFYFHADIHGAPSVIFKNGQNANADEMKLAAQFAGCFSSAWKQGSGSVDVYCVKPDQVKVSTKPGESMKSGSFMIDGKREWFKNVEMKLGIGFIDGKLLCAPVSVFTKCMTLIPDASKTKGETAKQLLFKLKQMFPQNPVDIDYVLEVLPNGGSSIRSGG